MRIKILVCCHKKDVCYSKEPYIPIHVGKKISQIDLGIQGDDKGDNISDKNGSYCELTGLYWAWKNLNNVDIVGLCHYRRYFDFHNQCQKGIPQTEFNTDSLEHLDFSVPKDIINRIMEGYIVLPQTLHLPQTLQQAYCESHISDDFRIMEQAVNESNLKNASETFDKIVKNGNRLSRYNMFLMKWDDFDEYCQWLFSVLGEVERKTDIINYNSVQKRIYGYMSERLLNVWIKANHRKTLEVPVIFISDNPGVKKNAILWKMRDLIWDFMNKANAISRSLSHSDR